MIDMDQFDRIGSVAIATLSRKSPVGIQYLRFLPRGDAHLAGRLVTAARDQRLFQVSVDEDLTFPDAFFKTAGVDDKDRLLQLMYPIDLVNCDELVDIFNSWIVELRPEKWLAEHWKGIF